MRIVLVLGAGATLAQAHHLHGAGVVGELPPLDTTFFDRLVDLKVKASPTLRNYAVDVLGTNPFAHDTPKPRWHVRFLEDVPNVDLRESQAVLALLAAIPVNCPAAPALAELLSRRRSCERVCEALVRWSRTKAA